MAPPIPVGTNLDNNRYKIIKVLGEGSFGRVYLAEDSRRYDGRCAIKEFAPDAKYAGVSKVEELFDRECRNLQGLDHPQIPKFRELFSTKVNGEEYILLVQDFIDGQNYHKVLESRSPFNEVETVNFLRQFLPILTYIHSKGIIHRDISPDNIICRNRDGKSEPVLIDFGIIKVLSNQYTQTNTIVGKQGYSPDEQLKQGDSVSAASDIYALAATVLYLLTKEEPGKLYDAFAAKFNLTKLAISPALRTILDRMLLFKRVDRYQSANEVLAALSNLPTVLTPAPNLPNPPLQPLPNPPNPIPPVINPSPPTRGLTKIFDDADLWGNIKKDFRKPFIYIGGGVVGLFLTIALLSAIFKGITGLFKPKPSEPSTVATAPSSKPTEGKNSLGDRLKAAKISTRDIDLIFYQKHPDKKGKSLTSSEADRALINEWNQIAEDLISKSTKPRK